MIEEIPYTDESGKESTCLLMTWDDLKKECYSHLAVGIVVGFGIATTILQLILILSTHLQN